MKDNGSILGKSEVVNALIEEGFDEAEASRAYEIMLDELERGLRSGRTLHFRRLFKVWPERMPPRRWWDNWHKKHIYFGERIMLKVKPFFLKDRNMPSERKIRAGCRSIEKKEPLRDSHLPINNLPRKEEQNPLSSTRKRILSSPLPGFIRGEIGKLNRAFAKAKLAPTDEEKIALGTELRAAGLIIMDLTSSQISKLIRKRDAH